MKTCTKCGKSTERKNSVVCASCEMDFAKTTFQNTLMKLRKRQMEIVKAFEKRLTSQKMQTIKNKINKKTV